MNIKETEILSELYYNLCGIETPHIQRKNTNPIIDSFIPLCLCIKSIQTFIYNSQYSCSIKRIISIELEKILKKYFEKLLELREQTKSLEELYVHLEDDIEMFAEANRLITFSNSNESVSTFNYIKYRKNQTVTYLPFYNELINKCINAYNKKVYKWIKDGIIIGNDFMVQLKNNSSEEDAKFNECYWNSHFILIKDNTPFYLEDLKDIIYGCGRIINTIKQITKKRKPILYEHKDYSIYDESMIIGEVVTDNNCLSYDINFDITEQGIKAYYSVINTRFMAIIKPILAKELGLIRNNILIMDCSFLTDIFTEMKDTLNECDDRIISKLNNLKDIFDNSPNNINRKNINYDFYNSKLSFVDQILKILNLESLTTERKLTTLQTLSIKLKPSKIFIILFPEKVLFELELIFRYLFTLFSIAYFLIPHQNIIFVNNILNIINYLRSSNYLNVILNGMEDLGDDVDEFVINLTLFTKKCLREFNLTNLDLFKKLATLLDLAFEFINIKFKDALTKEDILLFDKKAKEAVEELKAEMENGCTDCYLLFILNEFKWET
ncbi:hypothetical protein TCON_1608 [Astathelohania contejeani]|uniref:Spindle pole body component n=1 Tax=Astathelohania contejeani TaxID=164912 RepID=A0ABQ7HYB0_9MICR|nr:hypothetical protein TCON_1608 [Thelohania contejeani]